MTAPVQTDSTPDDAPNAAAGSLTLVAAMALLLLSALPDAMVAPVLRQLLVDRYGVSDGAAHMFMSVNLLGALVGAGFAGMARRRLGLRWAIILAAGVNAILLAVMALPIGFVATLSLRMVEGAADLIVYAVLFAAVARIGAATTRGRRMGAAATAMLIGIAAGLGVGGVIGTVNPVLCLWAGAAACGIVATSAGVVCRPRSTLAQPSQPATSSTGETSAANQPLWPALAMMFSDRAVGSILVTSVPLFLTSAVGLNSAQAGMLLGLAMLMTAMSAWPFGRLAERWGYTRLRVAGGVLYAGGLALIPAVVNTHVVLVMIDFALLGLGGGALFAASLMAVCASKRGALGMGAYHAAGNVGFMLGPLAAAIILTSLGGEHPDTRVYALVIAGFALLHAVVTTATTIAAIARGAVRVTEPAVF